MSNHRRKSTVLYRPFLREAWRLTWQRKSLWIFGVFAAIISTGGVVDSLWRSLQKVEHGASLLKNLADQSFIGYDLATSYLGQLALLGPQRSSFIVIALTLAGILLIMLSTLSQGALILGLDTKTPQEPHVLREKAGRHFWSLLFLGALNKLFTFLLVVLMTLPLLLISVSTNSWYALLFLLLMILLIPALIIVNIVYMFGLIAVVKTNAHPLDTIHVAIRLFARQWLATLEYGLILFLVVLGAGLGLIVFLGLLLIPYSMLYTVSVVSGSFLFFLIVQVISAFLMFMIVLLFAGACVTFQYSAWIHFYKHGLHPRHGEKVFSKILRLAHI